jgi:hypothetical protein
MESPLRPTDVKRIIAVSDEDAEALATWYTNLSRAVTAFPAADLKDVEPPLRSIAGPSLL